MKSMTKEKQKEALAFWKAGIISLSEVRDKLGLTQPTGSTKNKSIYGDVIHVP